ncbi:MAG TPA: accessory gene regulator B family protein [Clostridiaceae bacterium]|nr:accessory gene regulator B family protein [Clostridiaceae bacterium]
MNEISIHKIGQALGTYVSKKVSRADQTEVLSFGAEILVGCIIKLCILFSFAFIMDIALEVVILLIVTGIIRTLSGGAHCSAYYRCLATSVFIFTVLGYSIKVNYPFIRQLHPAILLGILVLTFSLYWIYPPQAPSDKPFKDKKIELVFRWYTLIAVLVFSITAIVLGSNSLPAWIISFALLWQAFTLSPVGHRFIGLCDILLTFKKKGGELEC